MRTRLVGLAALALLLAGCGDVRRAPALSAVPGVINGTTVVQCVMGPEVWIEYGTVCHGYTPERVPYLLGVKPGRTSPVRVVP